MRKREVMERRRLSARRCAEARCAGLNEERDEGHVDGQEEEGRGYGGIGGGRIGVGERSGEEPAGAGKVVERGVAGRWLAKGDPVQVHERGEGVEGGEGCAHGCERERDEQGQHVLGRRSAAQQESEKVDAGEGCACKGGHGHAQVVGEDEAGAGDGEERCIAGVGQNRRCVDGGAVRRGGEQLGQGQADQRQPGKCGVLGQGAAHGEVVEAVGCEEGEGGYGDGDEGSGPDAEEGEHGGGGERRGRGRRPAGRPLQPDAGCVRGGGRVVGQGGVVVEDGVAIAECKVWKEAGEDDALGEGVGQTAGAVGVDEAVGRLRQGDAQEKWGDGARPVKAA